MYNVVVYKIIFCKKYQKEIRLVRPFLEGDYIGMTEQERRHNEHQKECIIDLYSPCFLPEDLEELK